MGLVVWLRCSGCVDRREGCRHCAMHCLAVRDDSCTQSLRECWGLEPKGSLQLQALARAIYRPIYAYICLGL